MKANAFCSFLSSSKFLMIVKILLLFFYNYIVVHIDITINIILLYYTFYNIIHFIFPYDLRIFSHVHI